MFGAKGNCAGRSASWGFGILPVVAIAHALGHWSRLARTFNLGFVPMEYMLFVSGAGVSYTGAGGTFKSRPRSTGGRSSSCRPGSRLACLCHVSALLVRGVRPVSALFRGFPAILIAFGALGIASTSLVCVPFVDAIYKSIEYVIDVAVMGDHRLRCCIPRRT